MRMTRRDFVKNMVVGAAGLSIAGSLIPGRLLLLKKSTLITTTSLSTKKEQGALGPPTIISG